MVVNVSLCSILLRILFGLCVISLLHFPAQGQAPDQLRLNARIQKQIATGETHTYQFEAQTKHYLRLKIGRSTAHIMILIIGTDGRQAATLNCLRCESVSLSFVASATGRYTLVVRSEEVSEVGGRYDIVLDEYRSAISSDQKRIAAEQALSEGDLLRAEWNAAASQKALEKYQAALLGWQTTGERAGQSRALRAMGDVYRSLSELQKARSGYMEAYHLAGNDAYLKAGAVLGLGLVSITLGDNQKGVAYGTEALVLSKKVGDRAGEARALFCIGDAYFYLNGQGAAYYEKAMAAVLEANDVSGQAMAYLEMSYPMGHLPQKQAQALEYKEKALKIWRLLGDKRGQTTTLIALGLFTAFIGDYQQALAYFHEAEPFLIGCGEVDNEARLYDGLAFAHESLGDQKLALQYYLKALSKWRSAKFRNVEVLALTQVGRLCHETGKNILALNYLLQAKRMVQTVKNSPSDAWVYAHLGVVYSTLGREKEALIAYQTVLKENVTVIPWIRALALNGTGKIYQRRKDYKEAISWYNRALTISRDSHDPFGEVSTLNNIARAERDSDNLDAALKILNEAIQKIEMLRAKMTEPSYRATYFATTREAYELTINILMRLSQRGQSNDFITKAFEVSERARARSLLDILVESKTEITPENNPALLKEKRSLLARITEKNRALAHLYANGSSKTQSATVEQELAELEVRRKYIESIIRAANPRYAALTQPEPSKLHEIQQLLDSETMLLEYSLGDDKSYLWAITADSITSFQLPSQAEIEKVARQVYELLIAPNKFVKGESDLRRERRLAQAEAEYPKVALRLSQMILAPATSLLGTKRLVIVADGALQYIPFAALPDLKTREVKSDPLPIADFHPLIEAHEIINLPSASALSAIRRELESRKPAAKAIAVIADPVFNKEDAKSRLSEIRQGTGSQVQTRTVNLQRAFRQMEIEGNKITIDRLPFSHEEAMAILSILPQRESLGLLNFQANKQTVMDSDLNQYRIVHFATHGLLNSEHPELSGIVLSLVDKVGKPQNGFLRLHEIYNLKLPAELVVLSACQTALGKEIKGEGLVGLTRGFMYAGAARVVASLWNVNDAATADLMSHFYKYILQDKQQPAEALRNAQRMMRKQKRWKSPYYWAAFTIQGEWK